MTLPMIYMATKISRLEAELERCRAGMPGSPTTYMSMNMHMHMCGPASIHMSVHMSMRMSMHISTPYTHVQYAGLFLKGELRCHLQAY